MTPVISPWVFYLMPICDNVSFFSGLFFIFGLIAIFALTGVVVSEKTSHYPDEEMVNILTTIKKKVVVATVLLGMLTVFLPSETTITKMLVAQNVTYNRVEQVTDTVETVYNDIMELFEEDNNDR